MDGSHSLFARKTIEPTTNSYQPFIVVPAVVSILSCCVLLRFFFWFVDEKYNNSYTQAKLIMNRYLLSSLGRRLSFKSTCREFSTSSCLLKPYTYSLSKNFTSSTGSTKGKKELERLMSSTATATYDQSITSAFPSLVIGPDRAIEPQGVFAEAQVQVRKRQAKRTQEENYCYCLYDHFISLLFNFSIIQQSQL